MVQTLTLKVGFLLAEPAWQTCSTTLPWRIRRTAGCTSPCWGRPRQSSPGLRCRLPVRTAGRRAPVLRETCLVHTELDKDHHLPAEIESLTNLRWQSLPVYPKHYRFFFFLYALKVTLIGRSLWKLLKTRIKLMSNHNFCPVGVILYIYI